MLERLRAAGFTIDALAGLSAHELHVLEDVKRRLDDVEPEARVNGDIAGGALF